MSVGLKLDETKLVKDYILLPLLLDILRTIELNFLDQM